MGMVAEEAGVERSTVSRVLGGDFEPNRYRPETVERIQAAAEKLGYRRSLPALALKTGKTMTVGLIVADISVQFFSEMASYLDHLCWEAGYKLMVSNSREDPSMEASALRTMHEHMVDGVIISPCSVADKHINDLLRYDGEVVLVDRTGPQVKCPTVTVDNFGGAARAVEKLCRLGHKDIAAIMGRKSDPSIQERVRGYRFALGQHHVSPPANRLIYGATTCELAEEAAVRLLSRKRPPTAVFAGEAACSMGVIRAVRQLPLRIPQDVSLIGFDDFAASDLVEPPIDVIQQPTEGIARESFRILMASLKGKRSGNPEQLILPVELLERASCAAVPG